ncbi:MAG: UDP-glucose 4-epimerase GalE, partial [Gammaproteobacteria bacterium]|nr:UDP-glucose 4-epimerase GalE [Gammaproteobacteria bacterium]
AGYIGSHVVKMLGEQGHQLVILDDLSKGFRDAVLYGTLVVGNTGDRGLVSSLLQENGIEAVMHFAAHTIVPESVSDPLKYYGNNTCNTRNLLECCRDAGIKYFIFSSTAAVYGIPGSDEAISEDAQTRPINPYGMSKLMSEMMLRDLCASTDMKYVALRYFNVAGCDPEGRIGQSTPEATLLIKVACEVATGKRDALKIFGTDYPTPDGTGIRDYIHVVDLSSAHLEALKYLQAGGDSVICNCGYGHGYSVREVITALNEQLDEPIKVIETDRRPGDPPSLIANSDRIHSLMDWQPQYDDISVIIKSALNWERTARY